MHDVLRQRLMRHIESLPEEQIYQVLDYIEFLESKYSRDLSVESSGLQRFAEGLEDKLRRKAVNPANIREAFQLIAAADRVLSSVSSAGKQILSDLGSLGELPAGDDAPGGTRAVEGGRPGSAGSGGGRPPSPGMPRPGGGAGRDPDGEGGRSESG